MRGRIRWLDRARGAAVLGMVAFHLCHDLALFGLAGWETGQGIVWRLFAGTVAGGFLAIAGAAGHHAHRGGIRWPALARRTLTVGGAACLVTAATALTLPRPILFGILHALAIFGLLAPLLNRAPTPLLVALAIFCLAAPWLLPPVDHWIGYPLGLYPTPLGAPDYEPLLPWFAATLLGLGAARYLPAATTPGATPGWLGWAGRHSLAIYLLHQPALIGALALLTGRMPLAL